MRITLKAARVNAKLTQEEAAKRIGVAKKTIHNWETGKVVPTSDKIPPICDVYGRHYDEIKWTK